LLDWVALEELLDDVVPFEALMLELLAAELFAAEVLAVVLVFSKAAISDSTTAICEDTSCASVALALDFEASSVAISFSSVASCFCRAAICAVLLLEVLDPTAETMASPPQWVSSIAALSLCNGGQARSLRQASRKDL